MRNKCADEPYMLYQTMSKQTMTYVPSVHVAGMGKAATFLRGSDSNSGVHSIEQSNEVFRNKVTVNEFPQLN